MCLLAFAWNCHPRYRLIFAGNRDEFHARPAAAADWWQDATHVFGGRDLEAGGSWLGLARDGRFAVVTNFREPDRRPADKRTRGELVGQFLSGNDTPANYADQLLASADRYAGYNLIFGDHRSLHYVSNRNTSRESTLLEPGIHALSNHLLDTPWPKVQKLAARFREEVARDDPRAEKLLEFLEDREPAEDHTLPDTGLSPEWERALSAAHIVGDVYGTRASTVVMIEHSGQCVFRERRFAANGEVTGETGEHFGTS